MFHAEPATIGVFVYFPVLSNTRPCEGPLMRRPKMLKGQTYLCISRNMLSNDERFQIMIVVRFQNDVCMEQMGQKLSVHNPCLAKPLLEKPAHPKPWNFRK